MARWVSSTDLETGLQGTQDMDNEVRNDALHMLMMLLSALKPTNSLKHTQHKDKHSAFSNQTHRAYIVVFLQGWGVGVFTNFFTSATYLS